jgi:hypothetical protein
MRSLKILLLSAVLVGALLPRAAGAAAVGSCAPNYVPSCTERLVSRGGDSVYIRVQMIYGAAATKVAGSVLMYDSTRTRMQVDRIHLGNKAGIQSVGGVKNAGTRSELNHRTPWVAGVQSENPYKVRVNFSIRWRDGKVTKHTLLSKPEGFFTD